MKATEDLKGEETNAQAKYLAFAEKADKEGYKAVASLFRAAAKSEEVHTANFAKAIKNLKGTPKVDKKTPVVQSTKNNLENALKNETKESGTDYPALMKVAKDEGNKSAEMAYLGTIKANEAHQAFYKDALANLNAWKNAKKDFLVCTVCGYTTVDMSIKKCPVCSVPRDKFVTVN